VVVVVVVVVGLALPMVLVAHLVLQVLVVLVDQHFRVVQLVLVPLVVQLVQLVPLVVLVVLVVQVDRMVQLVQQVQLVLQVLVRQGVLRHLVVLVVELGVVVQQGYNIPVHKLVRRMLDMGLRRPLATFFLFHVEFRPNRLLPPRRTLSVWRP